MDNDRIYPTEVYDIVSSTSDIARARALAGAGEGTLILARGQTAGRGRQGRHFVSPADCGVYMSMVLYPESGDDPLTITARAAVAVARVIERTSGHPARIKWVNDVFQDGKKVCGILTEGRIDPQSGQLEYVILGIGINLWEPEGGYGEDLRNVIGAIFPGKKTAGDGTDPQRAALRRRMAEEIRREYFAQKNTPAEKLREEYVSRSLLMGRQIMVIQGGKSVCEAQVLGIDRQFGLVIRHTDGTETVLRSGEISVRELGNF